MTWTLQFTRTPSLNEIISWKTSGRHWRYAKLKKILLSQADGQRVAARAPAATGHRSVVITRHSPRELDPDGLVGGCKALLDALVRSGWLVDDKAKWAQVTYRQERSRADRTVVEVHEAA
jgi:hypothetical protein